MNRARGRRGCPGTAVLPPDVVPQALQQLDYAPEERLYGVKPVQLLQYLFIAIIQLLQYLSMALLQPLHDILVLLVAEEHLDLKERSG